MRINKYPFLLWLTQEREDLKVDLVNNKVYSDELGQSTIKKVPITLIVIMKYLPLVFLSSFFFIPRNLFEVGLAIFALIFIGIFYLLLNYDLILKGVIIAFCAMNFYLVFALEDYASYLSTALTLFTELLMISIVLYDIFITKGYKNWYFLESFKKEVNVKFAQKSEKKYLLFKKRNVGFNVARTVYIKGYFLRIDNEDV
jgi:hypothetical protein